MEGDELTITHKLIKIASGQFDVTSVIKLNLSNLGIKKIENLNECHQLENLDLSMNRITKIEGIDKLHKLKILNLSNNNITSLQGLEKLRKLEILEMENNNISDINELFILSALPALKSVNFRNNPICKDPQYETNIRKYVKNLRFLDEEHVLLKVIAIFTLTSLVP
jgi:Leucine-rich repeat (LRR) protein